MTEVRARIRFPRRRPGKRLFVFLWLLLSTTPGRAEDLPLQVGISARLLDRHPALRELNAVPANSDIELFTASGAVHVFKTHSTVATAGGGVRLSATHRDTRAALRFSVDARGGVYGHVLLDGVEYRVRGGAGGAGLRLLPITGPDPANTADAIPVTGTTTTLPPGAPAAMSLAPPLQSSPGPSTVRLLVAHQPGLPSPAATTDHLFGVTLDIFTDSMTNVDLELVEIRPFAIDYAAIPGDAQCETILETITNSADLQQARRNAGADLVAFIDTYSPSRHDCCGMAWMPDPSQSSASNLHRWGYSVNLTGACDDDVLAHEIGHNFSAHHDRDAVNDAGDSPPDRYYGYGDGVAGQWGTVMSYAPYKPSQFLFSNPLLDCLGDPCGQPDYTDVARVIREFGPKYARLHEAFVAGAADPGRFDLELAVNGAGSVELAPGGHLCAGDCRIDYAAGTDLLLHAVPDPGARFSGWTGACTGSDSCTLSLFYHQHVGADFSGGPALTPDLVVETLDASGDTALDRLTQGTEVTLSAGVWNRGTAAAPASTLRYYRSRNATVSTGDTPLGSDAVTTLDPDTGSIENITFTENSPPGRYWYGACVDSVRDEANVDNQCSAGVEVTVRDGFPDLAIDAASVPGGDALAGRSFTVDVTVHNRGDATAPSTTLRYYRSTDSTITSGDTQVASDIVLPVAADARSTETAQLTAPLSPGSYWYGACVDSVSGESDTTNQCSAAVQVTVYAPDLLVEAPGTSRASLAPRRAFTLSVTVYNRGDGAAPASTMRYVRSSDPTIDDGDTEVGTGSVPALDAGARSAEAISLVSPESTGDYWYGACVDAVIGEADTDNQCSSAVRVTVSLDPDLVPATPELPFTELLAAQSFTLDSTVRNEGDGAAPPATLRYYRSPDPLIDGKDTEIGSAAVAALDAGASSATTLSLLAPSTAGTYWYGICIDSVAGESNTDNQCSAGVRVTVSAGPDLAADSPAVSRDELKPDRSFTLSATVRNRGDAAAAPSTLRFFRSTDTTISGGDTEVDNTAVDALQPGDGRRETVRLRAPDAPGVYWYGVCVDSVGSESDLDNQCTAGVRVAVTVAPDLVAGPASVSAQAVFVGQSFTLGSTVGNQGDGAAPATTLRYFRSADATISGDDSQIGSRPVPPLDPGATVTDSLELAAPPPPGTWWYGSCVVSVSGESEVTNQCSAGIGVAIRTGPDLAAGPVSVSSTMLTPGEPFTMTTTARNIGDSPADISTLRFYRSMDSTITATDTEVGIDALAPLFADTGSTARLSLTAPRSPGVYWYGACVDAVAAEADASNQCSAAVQVSVAAADLVPESVTVSSAALPPGEPFTLSATVRNQGRITAASTTLRYYLSTDSTITVGDTVIGTDDVRRLTADSESFESILLTAPAAAGTYWYGACVDVVGDEAQAGNQCSAGIAVTVSAGPDLVAGSVSASDAEPVTAQAFTLAATVRNRGHEAAAETTVRFYWSADAIIGVADAEVGVSALARLAADAGSRHEITLAAPLAPGVYWYGACVDAVDGESDANNQCSEAAELRVADAGAFVIDDDQFHWNADIGLSDGAVVPAASAQLFRLYFGGLGRLPDAGGFAWWSEQIAVGNRDLQSMAAGFVRSPELQLKADADGDGVVADREFIIYMYRNVLGREPDREGLDFWLGELADGRRSQADVLLRMTGSNEYVLGTKSVLAGYFTE